MMMLLKRCWEEYIYKKSTIIGLLMIYLGIFHWGEISRFWDRVLGSDALVNAVAMFMAGFFIRSTK
jgi:multisubunit Na+/H+ antiporter MnhF subunit